MAIRPPWSRGEALAAGHAFVARTGTLPGAIDLHPRDGLPSYNSIKKMFDSLPGYHAALGGPPPRPAARPAPATPRACLRCDGLFPSPAPSVRLCPACKRTPGDDADLEWMNGGVRRWL
jgi:hypothetical protein